MSWKIYPLGQVSALTDLAGLVTSKLTELGYTVTFTAGAETWGTLEVDIGGIKYSGYLSDSYQFDKAAYLCVDAETNAIVVCKDTIGMTITATDKLGLVMNFALLHGTDAITGDSGLFLVKYTDVAFQDTTNVWKPTEGDTVHILYKAAFKKNQAYTPKPFVSDLFWGSVAMTPGVTFELDGESFVCLNGCLYAKL